MGECDLDTIEREDLQGPGYPAIANEIHFRRKVIPRNVEIMWRCEVPCTGENGNDIASDSLGIRLPPGKPVKTNLFKVFFKLYEDLALLGSE